MASNLDKTNELLDFMHAKVHSFYRSSVLLWFLHEIICSSLKGKLFASPFFAIYSQVAESFDSVYFLF